jgi:two-component system phosphate regulon response regulator OmpR
MNAVRQRAAVSAQAPHILVVDDDRRLRELLARFLSENGFRVTVAKDTLEARARRELFIFDGVVLDVMMPGENGFDFARVLRAESDIPIMMLTARVDTVDRVEGLEIGADDYLPKPFEPRELLLRLNNMLRRTAAATAKAVEPADTVSFGDFIFRIERGELRQGNELVRLTDRERELLQILARKYGETVPREEIAGDEELGERTVDVQINRLRRKIEADPSNPVHLQTVRGAGYRLLVD